MARLRAIYTKSDENQFKGTIVRDNGQDILWCARIVTSSAGEKTLILTPLFREKDIFPRGNSNSISLAFVSKPEGGAYTHPIVMIVVEIEPLPASDKPLALFPFADPLSPKRDGTCFYHIDGEKELLAIARKQVSFASPTELSFKKEDGTAVSVIIQAQVIRKGEG